MAAFRAFAAGQLRGPGGGDAGGGKARSAAMTAGTSICISMRSVIGPEMLDWYSVAQRGPRLQAIPETPPFPQRHTHVAFFPNFNVSIKTARKLPCLSKAASLGAQLRWRRRRLGLRQEDVAVQLGVNVWTVANWEKDKHGPQVEHWPRVIAFLGRDPFSKPRSLGDHIYREMRARGLSYKAFAKEIGMSPETLTKIAREEYGVIDPRVREEYNRLQRRFMKSNAEATSAQTRTHIRRI